MNRNNVVDAFELTSVEWALVESTKSNLDVFTQHICELSKSHVMKWRDGKHPETRPVNFRFFNTTPRELPLAAEILDRFWERPDPVSRGDPLPVSASPAGRQIFLERRSS